MIDAIAAIDTGFTDYLTLSPPAIQSLRLPSAGTIHVSLAEGSRADLGVYAASVECDGTLVEINVLETDGDALVGMALLYGSAIYLEVVDGGSVEISRLPIPP